MNAANFLSGALSPDVVALLYLASGILFILALRGLSSPDTSRAGNTYGMIGMTIAIITTLAQLGAPNDALTWVLILGGLGIGGAIGAVTAKRIPMTAMPELVAAFHSLVGLAAVFVAAGAVYAPEAFSIALPDGSIRTAESDRDVAGRGHRCHHVYRLGDRVCEALWAHVG